MVVIGKEMRAAVKYHQEKEEGITSYPYHYTEAECLMAGDYDRFDLWDKYDEEAFGIDAEAFPALYRDPHLGVIS